MGRPHAIAIIPARLGSTRFPGKVLANDTGSPLIEHVYRSAKGAKSVERVVVATDDHRVSAAVERFGGEFVLTSPHHSNGSSRLAQAAQILNLRESDIIVNVQGDEPELDPSLIDAAVAALVDDNQAHVSTIASPFGPDEDPRDPNIVKVVRRTDGLAMYFSRSLIPCDRDGSAPPEARPLKHIGLYCYRRRVLTHYAKMAETPLETAEKLEQLRFLERGYRIAVVVLEAHHHGIDTPEQYAAFVDRYRARIERGEAAHGTH